MRGSDIAHRLVVLTGAGAAVFAACVAVALSIAPPTAPPRAISETRPLASHRNAEAMWRATRDEADPARVNLFRDGLFFAQLDGLSSPASSARFFNDGAALFVRERSGLVHVYDLKGLAAIGGVARFSVESATSLADAARRSLRQELD